MEWTIEDVLLLGGLFATAVDGVKNNMDISRGDRLWAGSIYHNLKKEFDITEANPVEVALAGAEFVARIEEIVAETDIPLSREMDREDEDDLPGAALEEAVTKFKESAVLVRIAPVSVGVGAAPVDLSKLDQAIAEAPAAAVAAEAAINTALVTAKVGFDAGASAKQNPDKDIAPGGAAHGEF